MDQQRWKKINKIVDKALNLERNERSAFIQKECDNNYRLQKEVTELLQSIEKSNMEQYLEGKRAYPRNLAADFSREHNGNASSMIGQTIGHYKILEIIGHGGMGSVFLAERADDAYDRQVALKLMRRGMDTPTNIARFKRERHILAQLDHPNIAHLLDGGVTESGLPYLVMDYVEGISVYEYCNRQKLSIKKRLTLFKTVCKAVQHAHQNAIIHRDLKPSNILVTNDGKVKVLDFGIAKMLENNDDMFKTQTGARMLTPGYAAPEQLKNEQITTSTDAYMLGIVLYELLSGTSPLDNEGKNFTEIEELIRNKIPDRPSQAYAQLTAREQQEIANNRKTTPSRLTKELQGDLDAIIKKALRKEPETRYYSAEQLLEDLQRRAQNLPIIAHEDTWQYNASKFIERHKTGLSVAVGFLLLIIGFSIFYTLQMREERNKAQLETKKAEAVTSFLTDLIEANYPQNTQGDTVTVKQFLDKGFNKIQKLNKTPFKQAEIMQVMGYTYRRLGENKKAQKLISKAVPLLKSEHAPLQELAKAYDTSGLILRDLGKPEKAIARFKQAKKMLEDDNSISTAIYAKTLRDMAYVELVLGNYEKASPLIKRAIAIDKQVNGKQSTDLSESYHIYASSLRRQRKFTRALKFQKKSFSILEKKKDGPSPGKAANLGNLGTIYNHLDSVRQSLNYYKRALSMDKKLYGADHWKVATITANISKILLKKGSIDSAKKYSDTTLAVAYQALPHTHPWISNYLENRARIYSQMHQFHKADSLFQEAFDIAEKHYKPSHTVPMDILLHWAENKNQANHFKQSARLYAKAFRRQKNAYGMDDSYSKNLLRHLINTERKLGNTAKVDSLETLLATN